MMNKLLVTGLLLCFSLCAHRAFPCSCPPYPTDFCTSVKNDSTNYIATVKVLSMNLPDMEVAIIEQLHLTSVFDTIIIKGQDGINCFVDVSIFTINDTLILGLYNWNIDSFGISMCGLYYLRLSNDTVTGKINSWLNIQDYSTFKANLINCLNFVSMHPSNNENNQIVVYPNPFTDFLTIEQMGMMQEYDVELIDIYGRLVYKNSQFDQDRLHVSGYLFTRGIYILKVENEIQQFIKKIIVL
ncbi:MAG: T9SS type A sorting domain-containing protein [Bacteroidetes bacterium]|nr:T9SS type A sorting domain-containing protein [Bacteroidota bacterium]